MKTATLPLMTRAWSLVEIKAFDDDKRTFEGIATTPVTDRMDDIVESDGGVWRLPVPLKWQHGKGAIKDPVGWITQAKPTKRGIEVKGTFAQLDEPPSLKEDLDRAWALTKARLMPGLSIGFRGIDYEPIKGGFGLRYTKWELLEVSVVDIPANQDATILTVKSIDAPLLAASGDRQSSVVRLDATTNLPGVSGQTRNKGKTMTISEQITQFENKRAANVARMTAIMEKSAETGSTLEQAEEEEHDTLQTEVESIDKHLVRLRVHEKTVVAKAVAVTPEVGADPKKSSEARGGHVVQVKSNTPKGTTFSRWVLAQIHAKGDVDRAADYSRKAWPDMPEVEMILRAQVLPGTTTATTWAAPLIPAAQNMQNEFLDLLRPATLIGRIPGLRRVPANISVPSQTGGATFQWVGEGIAKPVSALAFSAVTLRWAKAAGIVVITKELARYSSPDAEATVRDSMVKDCGKFLDEQFITPTVAEVTNVSPAAITNGATTAAASGVTAAAFESDMTTAIGTFVTANDDVTKLVILMSGGVALNVMKLRDALGNKIYPEMTLTGGTIMGLPVIVSNSVGARIVIVNANDILYNDDGPIEIDASEQASIVMDDTPAASPQTTSLVSLWQHNYLGIRVEKWTTWKRARSTSVYYISNAVYSG